MQLTRQGVRRTYLMGRVDWMRKSVRSQATKAEVVRGSAVRCLSSGHVSSTIPAPAEEERNISQTCFPSTAKQLQYEHLGIFYP